MILSLVLITVYAPVLKKCLSAKRPKNIYVMDDLALYKSVGRILELGLFPLRENPNVDLPMLVICERNSIFNSICSFPCSNL